MTLYIQADKSKFGCLQIQICDTDDVTGDGGGYRLLGPKYDGGGGMLHRKRLTKRDAKEIRSYLEKAGL